MLGYRSDDAVLTICQNNASKSIEIVSVNDAATALIGYKTAELAGRKLEQLIPERLSALMNEYVEFEPDANDVGMVFAKVQSFAMHTKDRKERAFRLKVVRGESTRDKITFRLVLQDPVDARKGDALHKLIQENFKGHEVLHATLGIPNRKSLEKDIELLAYYHHKAQLRASFVMAQIDHFDSYQQQYGDEQATAMFKHIIHICRSNLRPGDVVGAANDSQLGILLLDSISDSTRMVANRLRWQIAAHPFMLPNKTALNLSASMAYMNVDGLLSPDKLVLACETQLASLPNDSAGHLVAVAV